MSDEPLTLPLDLEGNPLEGVSLEPGGKLKIELLSPVEQGDELLESVTLRKPGGKEYRLIPATGLDAATMDLILTMASNMSGVHDATIDKMSVKDLGRISRCVAHFFN